MVTISVSSKIEIENIVGKLQDAFRIVSFKRIFFAVK